MVVGVAAKDQVHVFCYAQIRPYRDSDRYPAPNFPKNTTSRATSRVSSRQGGFAVLYWERPLTYTEAAQIADLSTGRLAVPEDCPIGPRTTLEGRRSQKKLS